MAKLITLYKRPAGMAVEEFQARFLEEEVAAARRLPGLLRHVQSHGLVQGYRKGELLFDGMSECYFADAGAARAARGAVDASGFADPLRTVHMPVEVHVAKDGRAVPGAVKNIEFVNRRPGMALGAFRHYWRSVHGPLGATIPSILRYEQNHLDLGDYELGVPPYDGLAITWFESTAAMRAGAETPEYEVTREDEANFLPDGHLPIIITREVHDSAA
ncbi:EthD family reductase [Zavarzinia compransoris]|uniref:EthD domain-containing protein n=1 Tax=Zavarzinia compransoris TaxID=1264899 RepID=A0A317E949_9PROT|nr:EthD family reductase [Zavarzinia compransoris]PWR21635.1 hypothetical protein DKG75_06440 [Zavarzinia compransoris]TDP45585.1 uncharacterized protein (TIGR02118 family) [Zavarzinia compransoris]